MLKKRSDKILIFICTLAAFLPAMVNSFIHVLMYSYYGLAALGPSVAKYLWWKKYLTILQLIQFTTALILGINGIRSGCDFPLWMQYALVIYMLSFIVLFGNFYAKAYIAKVRRGFRARSGIRYLAHTSALSVMIDVCLQGKQVYAEKRLERIKAAQMLMNTQLDDAISNGKIANGHANGHANGYTKSKKKTQ